MQLDQSSMDVSTLVAKVSSGEIDLQPDFQRGQVWPDSKKKRLIDTILRRWYVPAIHIVVNDDLDQEEVLDGQQRLRTILEFMDDRFTVDGSIQPRDEGIVALNGLTFSRLPDGIRSRFRRFTVTTIRLRDYEPEEPGELFFRLNQLTALTAAEQRNALVGEPRNQIRRLAGHLASRFSDVPLGFSNARMNFDDVLSRLAFSLEVGSLSEKVTATRLERRYRSGAPFPTSVINLIEASIERLSLVFHAEWPWKQNKATLFSWFYFLIDNRWARSNHNNEFLVTFFNSFEALRADTLLSINYATDPSISNEVHVLAHQPAARTAIRIFNDRSSSRVNDVSSVILRDVCLNLASMIIIPDTVREHANYRSRFHALSLIASEIELSGDDLDFGQQAMLESRMIAIWERYSEAR